MRLKRGNVERIAESTVQIEKLKKAGFEEVKSAEPVSEEATSEKESNQEKEGKALDDMSVAELRALAKEKGLKGTNSLGKEELLAALEDVEKDVVE